MGPSGSRAFVICIIATHNLTMSAIIKITNGQHELLESINEPTERKVLYWSRCPGKFVNKYTGLWPWGSARGVGGPSYEGTVQEWYETLAETIMDAHHHILRRQYGAPNILEVNDSAFTILQHTVVFSPNPNREFDGLLFGFMNIKKKRELPLDEIRIALVLDFTTKLVPGIPSNPPEMIEIGGKLVQAPVLPGFELERLPAPQLIDEMTIKILDMHP